MEPIYTEREDGGGEHGGERFGFLKISAIREIGPERIEVELELTPAAARDPINLESLGLRDVQIGTRESRSGGRSVWLTGSGDFFGSVGDTVRLLPMSGISREPRRKVYWRKTISSMSSCAIQVAKPASIGRGRRNSTLWTW